MANYFLTDPDGTKRGPYDEQRLQQLADWKSIEQHTPLETDTGQTIMAEEIPGLNFTPPPSSLPITLDITRFTSYILIPILWIFFLCISVLNYGMMVTDILSNKAPFWNLTPLSWAFLSPLWTIDAGPTILVATVALLLDIIFIRVILELLLAVFRIEVRLREQEQNTTEPKS